MLFLPRKERQKLQEDLGLIVEYDWLGKNFKL